MDDSQIFGVIVMVTCFAVWAFGVNARQRHLTQALDKTLENQTHLIKMTETLHRRLETVEKYLALKHDREKS